MTAVQRILSYPFFLAGAAAVLIVLGVFEIIQRICYAAGPQYHERSVYYLNKSLWLCLKIVGARLEIKHRGELPPPGQSIIISNHQSMFDIVLIALIMDKYRPKFIAKSELARGIPSVSYNLHRGGNVVIDRSTGDAAAELERRLRELKGNGASFVLFPEGSRSKTGELKEFRPKGLSVLLAELPDAPVIIFTLDNSWIFTDHKFGPVPFGVRLKVMVGPVLHSRERENGEAFADRIKKIIQSNLDELRNGENF